MNSPPAPLDRPPVVLHRTRLVQFVAVAALLVLHWLLAVGSKRGESVTSDELAHLTGGFVYWQFNDYRIQPENGNFPQRWAALPTWLAGAKFPPLQDNAYWKTSDAWILGHEFFYETGEDHFPRLMAGRAMMALFSVATGLLIFAWSGRVFGTAGAFVSLIFYAFSPNFLAHGALVTSDICIVFFLLASVGAYWRHLHDPRLRWWLLSAGVLGLACVAKYSAALLLPIMLLMAVVRAASSAPLNLGGRPFVTPSSKFAAIAISTLAQGLVAVLVIWAFFGFRYTAFNPALPGADQFIQPWEIALQHIGGQGAIIRRLAGWHLLPEAYLYGYSFVVEMSQFRWGFLDGDYSLVGWTRFFPLAFLYKSTLPVLLACIAVVGVAVLRWRRSAAWAVVRDDLYRVVPLLGLFVIYWLVSLRLHLNIGHRHILPVYPVLFIFFGVLGRWLDFRRPLAAFFVAVLLAWQVSEAGRFYPHYLAYFNPIAGGPGNGRHHLVDSSLDWGQDLPGLKAWLDGHPTKEPVYLSYFGSGEPVYYGLRVRHLTSLNNFQFPFFYTPLEAGTYCISATMLAQVYGPAHGLWNAEQEADYQRLRRLEPTFAKYERDPLFRGGSERDVPEAQWRQVIQQFDRLRLARLCEYLRVRHPDAEIGYSILVYRLTAAEIAGATTGSLADLATLIEKIDRKSP